MATIQSLLENAQEKVNVIAATFELSESQLDEFTQEQDAVDEMMVEIREEVLAVSGAILDGLKETVEALDQLEQQANQQFEALNLEMEGLQARLDTAIGACDPVMEEFSGELQTAESAIQTLTESLSERFTDLKGEFGSLGQEVAKQFGAGKDAASQLIERLGTASTSVGDAAGLMQTGCNDLVEEIRNQSDELNTKVNEACGNLDQAFSGLQERVSATGTQCEDSVTQQLVAAAITFFDDDCDTTDTDLSGVVTSIEGLAQNFGGDVSKALEKIESVIELIEKIEPVLEMVDDLT